MGRLPFDGAAGRAGTMRAIAPSKPPHALSRKGRRRPMPWTYAADEAFDFALVAVNGPKNFSACPRRGCWRPMPSSFAAGAGGVGMVQACASSGAPAAKLRPAIQTRRARTAAELRPTKEFVEGILPRAAIPPFNISAELNVSCCGSVAALPAQPNCNENVIKKMSKR
jgi:hypothetical protein